MISLDNLTLDKMIALLQVLNEEGLMVSPLMQTARDLGVELGVNSPTNCPDNAIIVTGNGNFSVSEKTSDDLLRQCARCGEQYDYTPDSPALCDDCIAAEMEEALCKTCGGTGEVIDGQYFNGEYKYAVCEECSGIDDSAYDDWKDHCHHIKGRY